MFNPQIDAAARGLRDEIETLERNIAAGQRELASKQDALKALESLNLHTPAEDSTPAKKKP